MAQQQDHREVFQEYYQWIECIKIPCSNASSQEHDNTECFVPESAVRAKFRDENYRFAEELRIELFGPESYNTVSARDITENCVLVFCILLSMKQGQYISHFITHPNLHDNRLPFMKRPDGFPNFQGYPDDSFERFQKEQAKFTPVMMKNVSDLQLRDQAVLPFTYRKPVAYGGTSHIDKVIIHPEYDRRARSESEYKDGESPQCYAIKTYSGPQARDYYKRELAAFRALDIHNQHNTNPYMVCFYGSYVHRGTFNIILEFADRGTLEDFFENEQPPSAPLAILAFWRSLFNVLQAVHRLHEQWPHDTDPDCRSVLHGLHRDIKPKNILVFSKTDSPDEVTFKLADLGLTHFEKTRATSTSGCSVHYFGTKTYGAPETLAWSDFEEHQHLTVKQTIDIWSFGCVCSEASIWVIKGLKGTDGLLDYRRQRSEDPDRHPGFRGGDCFHNGTRLRLSVIGIHGRVRDDYRERDLVTRQVLESVLPKMLNEQPQDRLSAKLILREVGTIIKNAETALIDGPHPASTSSSRPSPAQMIDQHHSRFPSSRHRHTDWPAQNATRSSTMDVPNNRMEHLVESPKRFSMEENEENVLRRRHINQGLSERNLPSQEIYRSRTDAGRSPPSNHQFHRKGTVGRSRGQQAEEPRQNYAESSILHGQNQDRAELTQVGSHSVGKATIRDQGSLVDVSPHAGAHAPKDASHVSDQPYSRARPRGETGLGTRGSKSHPKKPLPYLSVDQALQYRAGRGQPPLDPDLTSHLHGRDHMFLIDDSTSMGEHWAEMLHLLEALIYLTKKTDDDGVEICFMWDPTTAKAKDTTKLMNVAKRVRPCATTPIDPSFSLGDIISRYEHQILQTLPIPNRRSFLTQLRSLSGRNKDPKPLSIYVLTTGQWGPNCNLDRIFKSLDDTLHRKYLETPIGIQFIRFGNDPTSKARLKRYDGLKKVLNLSFDFIDTEPSNRNVWKMLLGSIKSIYDDDDTDDDDDDDYYDDGDSHVS